MLAEKKEQNKGDAEVSQLGLEESAGEISTRLIRLVLLSQVSRGCVDRVYLAFSGYFQKVRELRILRIISLFLLFLFKWD